MPLVKPKMCYALELENAQGGALRGENTKPRTSIHH